MDHKTGSDSKGSLEESLVSSLHVKGLRRRHMNKENLFFNIRPSKRLRRHTVR